MRTFNITLTLAAIVLLGLSMTSTASATITGVSNGDFQTQPMQENWSDNDIWVWYDHNSAGTAGTDLIWMDEVGTYSYGAGSTTVCEFTNGWNGYIYQQIGTYTENELIEVAGTMLRREQHNTGMLRFTLHVGSGLAADNTDVYDFTDLVDTVHVDGFSLAGLPATGSSGPYPGPAASANFTTTLDSGTGHTVGDPIWLHVTADFGGWAVVAVDNISVTAVPEPSLFALAVAGILGLIAVGGRKRHSA